MNNRFIWVNSIVVGVLFLGVSQQQSYAVMLDCAQQPSGYFHKTVCKDDTLKNLNSQIQEKYLNAQLMSNAPLKLIKVHQDAWFNFVKQCKSRTCISQNFEQQMDSLTLLTTMNQSLTQHFIRYKDAQVDHQTTYIQLQQLDKDKIKIEGLQYRNPNNNPSARVLHLHSYTSPDQFSDITDLESKCSYSLQRTSYGLSFKALDSKCQRFNGVYKLYD